ncbi:MULTISPECIES: MFS transporter [Salinibaculum]|uniref:MFS transporter n=1 Tax=Salinibaculum TaxID=2732368 RepID=UPI0030D064B6
MAESTAAESEGDADPLDSFRQFVAMPRDVLVLSVAMFAFSLGFQMTTRYVPEYMRVLGAGPVVVGLYKSLGDLIGAVYPYPGGAVSDRVGSRVALTVFGFVSALGFAFWLVAPGLSLSLGPVTIPGWVWIFVGLFLVQAWKSFGLGATFAVVKQSTEPQHLAAGFASTETFRRVGFLLGLLAATALLAVTASFVVGFQAILAVAIVFAVAGTVVQHFLYDSAADTIGKSFEGIAGIRRDLREMPDPLQPLLLGDTLVRFGNGMIYAFVIFVITDIWQLEATVFGIALGPAAFFGVLLAVEMVVALLSMYPVARLAERTGLKPVVGLGFVVYAVFPVVLITAPPDPLVVGAIFAFSGLRFAGLPAHKALIVGPAEQDTGGRVTGTYYLVRNTVVIPSGVVGGLLYGFDPTVAFAVATAIGLLGTGLFLVFGEEFPAYA